MRTFLVSLGLLLVAAPLYSQENRDAAKRVEDFFAKGEGTTLAGAEDENTSPDFIELIGKTSKADDQHLLVDVSLGQGRPVVFEVARKDVLDVLPVQGSDVLKRVQLRTYERSESGLHTVSVRVHLTADLASLVEQPQEGTELADSNEGEKRDEIRERFSGAGGHVYIEGPDVIPQAAEARAAVHIPDLIRWVLEHKGINVTDGAFELGHQTVANWRYIRIPFDGRRKIGLPNTYLGYLGWKP